MEQTLKGSPKLLLEKIRNLCSRELGRRGLPAAQKRLLLFPLRKLYIHGHPSGYEELHELESLLKGRSYLWAGNSECCWFWGKEILAQALQLLCLEGKTALLPALYRKKGV